MQGTESQAESMLRDAVSHGSLVPAPRTVFGKGSEEQTNMIWDMGDSFIGVNIWDGWPLVWTAPKSGMRADFDDTDDSVSSFGKESKIDPWSDEIDDFATAVHWITPEALRSIMGDEN